MSRLLFLVSSFVVTVILVNMFNTQSSNLRLLTQTQISSLDHNQTVPHNNNSNANSNQTESHNNNGTAHGGVESHGEGHSGMLTPKDWLFWVYLGISSGLVIFAGLCSGLTVGYLSIDKLKLEIKLKTGSEIEKQAAISILPILEQHHKLLATLLLSNAFAMEALPVFMHRIVPAYLAILISCVFVIIFGEIIPQAYCTGPQQLVIASRLSCMVRFLMLILSIFTIPIAKLLDWMLGTHRDNRLKKEELKTLIELHEIDQNKEKDDESSNIGLTQQEIQMIVQTIDLRDVQCYQIVIGIEKVFMLHHEQKITKRLIEQIRKKGFSKIPIYDNNNNKQIMGILKTKILFNDFANNLNKNIIHYFLQNPIIVYKNTTVLDLLMIFQEHKTTIAMVVNNEFIISKEELEKKQSWKQFMIDAKLNKSQVMGLIALKDIFELVMNKDLDDDDNHLNQQGNYRKLMSSDLNQPLLNKQISTRQ